MVSCVTSSTHKCFGHPLYHIIKDRGVRLMLASSSTSAKAMSLRKFVPLIGNVCDPCAVEVMNILLPKLGPIPPLLIKSNYFIYVMLVTKLVTLASMLSHIARSIA